MANYSLENAVIYIFTESTCFTTTTITFFIIICIFFIVCFLVIYPITALRIRERLRGRLSSCPLYRGGTRERDKSQIPRGHAD